MTFRYLAAAFFAANTLRDFVILTFDLLTLDIGQWLYLAGYVINSN